MVRFENAKIILPPAFEASFSSLGPLTDRNSSCPQGCPREDDNASDKEVAGVTEAGFDIKIVAVCTHYSMRQAGMHIKWQDS